MLREQVTLVVLLFIGRMWRHEIFTQNGIQTPSVDIDFRRENAQRYTVSSIP